MTTKTEELGAHIAASTAGAHHDELERLSRTDKAAAYRYSQEKMGELAAEKRQAAVAQAKAAIHGQVHAVSLMKEGAEARAAEIEREAAVLAEVRARRMAIGPCHKQLAMLERRSAVAAQVFRDCNAVTLRLELDAAEVRGEPHNPEAA